MPRPSAGAVAIAATASATLLGAAEASGGSIAADIVAAAAVALLTLAVVPLAAIPRRCLLRYAVASAAAGAAAIHYAVVAEHFEEWWGFGLFFALCALAQLLWAMLVVTSRSRLLIWCGVVGNAAIVVLWIATRTVGTLVGPEPDTPEPVAVADSVATALELAIVFAGSLLTASVRRGPALSRQLAWVVSGVALVLTTAGLFSLLD